MMRLIRQVLVTAALCAIASAVVLVVSGPGARIGAVTGTAELANWGFDAGGGESSSPRYGAGWATGELALGQSESESFGMEGGFWTSSLCFDDNDGLDDAAEAALGTNTCAFDTDVDGLGDAEDACPTLFTAWLTHLGDDDCDGFATAAETSIGTSGTDGCADTAAPNDEADDKWPPDFDDNRVINTTDVFQVLPPYFGTSVPPTSVRRDLFPDGVINTTDVFKVLPPFLGSSCTP